jgi:hypothetical protein
MLPIFLYLVSGVTRLYSAPPPKQPVTWWPDPATGLMWTGESTAVERRAMTWDEAGSYCAALSLGGFSGWRLPTLQEMRSEEYLYPVTLRSINGPEVVDFLGFKGNVATLQNIRIWTTSPAGAQEYFSVFMGGPDAGGLLFKGPLKAALNPGLPAAHERVSKLSDHNYALCTRPMETDLRQIAKDAQVNNPVADLLTLKANVPLNKARLAFQAGQYQDAIAQAQSALTMKPDFAAAYWGIGISYGMLGQWDQAISNLEAALKIDNDYGDAKDSLKWAKDGQKAAKDDKTAKDQPPVWN